jgi:threonine/homoserine/homoserine lactone efflux protein
VNYVSALSEAARAVVPAGDLTMRTDLAVIFTTLTLYLAITVSPGPNFALVSRLAISGSRRAAVGASLGIASADFFYAVLTMTGLSVLLTEVGWVARSIQIVGGCYLVYLGLSAWFYTNKTSATGQPRFVRTGWYGVRMGFIVGLSNPKGIAFFVSLYAAAIPLDTSLWARAVIIAGGFLIEAPWYGLFGMLLSMPRARALYARLGKWIERFFGALMVGFGLRLIYDRSP